MLASSQVAVRRVIATSAVVAGALFAGCGGDDSSSTPSAPVAPQIPPSSAGPDKISQTVKAKGPADIDANLKGLVAESAPYMKNFESHCPARPFYPFHCKFTATDTRNGESKDVSGTVTVTGVYTPTRTYTFELSF